MPDINDELLTPTGMASARAALVARYEWFLHVKPESKFATIKKDGLQPRSQGCPTNPVVKAALTGKNVDEMIFLRPLGTFDSTPRRGERMFLLALARSNLPQTITVDWTFDGTWPLAPIIKHDSPHLAPHEIFCQVVRRRGSVAVYEPIPAALLRVWAKGEPAEDPSKWSRLVDTDAGDLNLFD